MRVMKRKAWLAGAFLLPVLGVLAMTLPTPEVPAHLDLIGMIKSIHHNNEEIGAVNGEIVGQMGHIDGLSDVTGRIGAGLHTLQQGVGGQQQSLAHLGDLSSQQVVLSQNLQQLAGTLQGDLTQVRDGGARQQQVVQSMVDTANGLAKTAGAVEQTNAAIAPKLDQAAALTAETARRMP
jgi:hypothetical protein